MRSFVPGALAALMIVASARAEATEAVKISHDGITLNGTLSMAAGTTLGDGVVLITHGTLAHNGMDLIRAMQERLGERGISTLAITLGLGVDDRKGLYDCAIPHRHRHEDALDEIGLWLNWLKAKEASRIVLMGHSRGAVQTARFAAERPDPVVGKVVLLAPLTWDETAHRARYQARFGTDLGSVLARAEQAGSDMMEGVDFLYCPGAKVSAATFASYYRPDPRLGVEASLPAIKVPTLVIAAGNDEIDPNVPKAVAPLADGKAVRLVTIADADHFFVSLFSDDAADAIEDFLKQ